MLIVIASIIALGAIVFGIYAILDATRESNRQLKELHDDIRKIAETIQQRREPYI